MRTCLSSTGKAAGAHGLLSVTLFPTLLGIAPPPGWLGPLKLLQSKPSKQGPLFHGGGVGVSGEISGCTVGNFTTKTWSQRVTGTAWNKCCL